MEDIKISKIDEMWPNPILEFKVIGSKTREEVFLSVGRALSQWEIIESKMGFLFAHLVESESMAAQRAYGSISNTSGRKTAIENAAEIFHDRHYKFPIDKLNLLTNHYGKAAAYRNRIAHGLAVEHTDEKGTRGIFLVPSFFSAKNREAQTYDFWKKATETEDEFYVHGYSYRYTHEDIDFLNSKFEVLSEMLGKFVGLLIKTQVENMTISGRMFSHDVRNDETKGN